MDMDDEKNIDVKADVQVGESGGEHADNPDISQNRALLQGGGLYVIGSNALITIDNGKILDNTTAGYVYNQDVTNEKGIVTLNDPDVTSKVVITFDSNNDAAIIGKDEGSARKNSISMWRHPQTVFLRNLHIRTGQVKSSNTGTQIRMEMTAEGAGTITATS